MKRIYERIEKTSENRLAPRSYYIPEGKSEYLLLNGEWNFAYYSRDIDVPEKIEKWDKIQVPSCWQSLGYENPNYSNINYPYPVDPPFVPDDNPCGVYEREFEVKQLWGKVYFVLEGVSSCGFVYVNDAYVGFTQGSHLQAEFDITEFVNEGSNTLRVKVLKWCCGSYLEDQDCFRYNGIFRDCYVLQRPENHIGDIEIIPNDREFVINLDGSATVRIYENESLLIESMVEHAFTYAPEHPILWNAEKPFLYRVEVERDEEIIRMKTGLRKIEVSERYELLVNGVSVKLHGVNRHDTHPVSGWYQNDEHLLSDLKLMKELNINCIRIWEWADHVVLVDGVQKYGGDFKGELTHDGNFCCDGMVFSDRSLKAGSFEVKAAYQPITTKYKKGSLLITNRYDFTNLNECDIQYVVEVDSKVIKAEEVNLDLEPHDTAELKLDLPVYQCELGAYLNVYVKKDDKEVAKIQHQVDCNIIRGISLCDSADMTQDEQNIYIEGKGKRNLF